MVCVTPIICGLHSYLYLAALCGDAVFALVVRFLGFGHLCTPCLSVHTGIQLAICYPAQLCCFVYVLRLLALHYPLVMHGVERGSHPVGGLAFITFSSCWVLGFRLPLLLSIH